MGEELIPQHQDRPAIIQHDGWTIYVSIRDAEYLRLLKVFKRRLADAHPDRGGSNYKFRKIMGERIRWQCEEARWYAQFGLYPPDGFKHAEVVVERRKLLKATSQYERKVAREKARSNGISESAEGCGLERRSAAAYHRRAHETRRDHLGGLGAGEGPAEVSGGDREGRS